LKLTVQLRPSSSSTTFSGEFGTLTKLNVFSSLGALKLPPIVGPRRIGKTSLLLQVERIVKEWEGAAAVTAYTDIQSPRSFTLDGWLEQVSRQLSWSKAPKSLADFSEGIESTLSAGIHPVLFLDEFEELALRPTEFTRDFFMTLRFCGQRGLSIITATRQPLSKLTEPGHETSPYYNSFALVPFATFSQAAAEEFVNMDRHGMIPFTSEEGKAVLDFAKGHPWSCSQRVINCL
jgi:hypothetical protein